MLNFKFLISRRFLTVGIVAATGAWCMPNRAIAQEQVEKINAEAAKSDITVQPLRGNVSVLMGSGGNISVLTGPDGTLMVDAGIAVSQKKIAAALANLGRGPIKYLIDTHYHWDHTDGNEWVHQAGATIIAHRNTLKDLSKDMRVEDWRHTFAPVPVAARPTILINDSKKMTFDGTTVELEYYGLSHTDSDISVYYKEPDILQTGDTWWNGYYPMIDYGAGGSIGGMIEAAKKNIALSTKKTIVIPGHGPVGNREQLIEYRDMLIGIRDKVSALKKQGKSLSETIAAKPTAPFDAKWGAFVIGPDLFTSLVYRGV